MSQFELILVPLGIIVGFGISEILHGWGAQIRARHGRAIYPLQVAASATVLAWSVLYLWASWAGRSLEWTVLTYFLVLAPALAIALAAHVVRIETGEASPPAAEQYFASSRPLYALLAVIPVSAQLMESSSFAGASVANPTVTLFFRIGLLSLFLFLCASQRAVWHVAALGGVWCLMAVMVARLFFVVR